MSENSVISLVLHMPIPNDERVTLTSRNYQAIDRNSFVDSLKEITQSFCHHGDSDAAFEWYNINMTKILDSVAPVSLRGTEKDALVQYDNSLNPPCETKGRT